MLPSGSASSAPYSNTTVRRPTGMTERVTVEAFPQRVSVCRPEGVPGAERGRDLDRMAVDEHDDRWLVEQLEPERQGHAGARVLPDEDGR